jgi:hypothetical protein
MAVIKASLDQLSQKLQGSFDLFICSASYEDRCRSIADRIDGSVVANVIVCQNENHRDLHEQHAKYLLGKFGSKAVRAFLDTTDPLKTADSIIGELKKMKRSTTILVDITTFTHEALLILLFVIRRSCEGAKVTCVYSSAKEYSVGDEISKKWLSKGIGSIRSVLGYPGAFLPSRKMHLVVLVGIEKDRAIELIGSFEPSFLSLGFAQSLDPSNAGNLVVAKHFFDNVRAIYGHANIFDFSCHDPFATKDTLLAQAKKHPGANTVIAPMNTKMSTVGAAFLCGEDPSIQLCYAQALVYNHKTYSAPGENFYLFTY